ncbi:MAG: 2-C-methyl-D-erythritol 4-phosphate cytidylyltransferase [Phycisphaerales bacterium]|nr:2-C-methyl-D-erythritol 4-phosphate cytidylyltransferase [Phycisphaerales bacterium]
MKVAVIIPAAGASRRYAQGLEYPRPKLDEDLGGRPVLQRTVELFTKHDAVSAIIVAGPVGDAAADFRLRYAAKLGLLGVTLCDGGVTHRWETVKAALAHVPADATHVAVHDAARPCTPPELIDRVLDAAAKYAAVVPAIDVPDTLKRVEDQASTDADIDPLDAILGGGTRKNTTVRRVAATIDRSGVVAVQTPQVFRADLLRRAYGQADLSGTDDAALVERLGEPVTVVQGDPRNVKLTVAADLALIRAILGVREGHGREAHKRF